MWQCAWVVQCWPRCCVYFHSYVCVWRTSVWVVTTTGTSRILELLPECLKAPTLHHFRAHRLDGLITLLQSNPSPAVSISCPPLLLYFCNSLMLCWITLFTGAEKNPVKTPWKAKMKTVSFRNATRWITCWALFSYHSCSAPPLNSPAQFGDISLLHCFRCFQYKCKVSQQNLNRITG